MGWIEHCSRQWTLQGGKKYRGIGGGGNLSSIEGGGGVRRQARGLANNAHAQVDLQPRSHRSPLLRTAPMPGSD